MVTKEIFNRNGPDTLKGMGAKEVIEFLLDRTRYALNEYRLIRDFTWVNYACGVPHGCIKFCVVKRSDRNGYSKGWIEIDFNYIEQNKLTEVSLVANKITESYVNIEPEHFEELFKED